MSFQAALIMADAGSLHSVMQLALRAASWADQVVKCFTTQPMPLLARASIALNISQLWRLLSG